MRTFILSLGAAFVGVGIAWFYSSLLDDVLLQMGTLRGTSVTPMSKMTFSDDLSQLLAGLSLTGVVLIAVALYGLDASSLDEPSTDRK